MEGHDRGIEDTHQFYRDLESPGPLLTDSKTGFVYRKLRRDHSSLLTLHPDEPDLQALETPPGAISPVRAAVATYLRVSFDLGTLQDDLRAFLRGFTYSVLVSGEPRESGSCSLMTPWLPRGGAREIKGLIQNGTITSWPWIEARFSPIFVWPGQSVSVRFVKATKVETRYPVTFEAALGPYQLQAIL